MRFLFAATVLAGIAGCAQSDHASYYADSEPPAPQVEDVPPAREGFVWAPGNWKFDGNSWVWVYGHFERIPTGKRVYLPGRWEKEGSRWGWHEGRWE